MTRAAVLCVLLLLPACVATPVSRGMCPATGLSGFVGRPVLDLAANEKMKPMRLVGSVEDAPAVRQDRLTIRTDAQGRIASLSCG